MRPGDFASASKHVRGDAQRGFVYVALLAILALLGVALAEIGTRWADRVQREREQELLRVGQIYAKAIFAYHHGSPGSDKKWPKSIEDLELDTRLLSTTRYLRTLYTDPMVPGQPLALVRDTDGTIHGVYSTSTAKPFRQGSVDLGVVVFGSAQRYSDWQFIPKVDQ